MSEEFYMNVTFELPDAARIEQLERLIEHLDLAEVDKARSLLPSHSLDSAQEMIESITIENSDYSNGFDLVQMYMDTYNESVDDMVVNMDKSSLKGEIAVEGYDHESVDFCSALVLMLFAIGATGICAKAGSAMWRASWTQSVGGDFKVGFEAAE